MQGQVARTRRTRIERRWALYDWNSFSYVGRTRNLWIIKWKLITALTVRKSLTKTKNVTVGIVMPVVTIRRSAIVVNFVGKNTDIAIAQTKNFKIMHVHMNHMYCTDSCWGGVYR